MVFGDCSMRAAAAAAAAAAFVILLSSNLPARPVSPRRPLFVPIILSYGCCALPSHQPVSLLPVLSPSPSPPPSSTYHHPESSEPWADNELFAFYTLLDTFSLVALEATRALSPSSAPSFPPASSDIFLQVTVYTIPYHLHSLLCCILCFISSTRCFRTTISLQPIHPTYCQSRRRPAFCSTPIEYSAFISQRLPPFLRAQIPHNLIYCQCHIFSRISSAPFIHPCTKALPQVQSIERLAIFATLCSQPFDPPSCPTQSEASEVYT